MSVMLKYKRLSFLFIIFSIVYLAISMLATPDKAALTKYHISAGQLKSLVLTIAIPYLVIWFIALVGYLRLKDYTLSIKGDQDGAAYSTIAKGVLLLTLWLPLSGVVGAFTSQYYHSHPAATANMVRLNNYINLIILFAAYLTINRGTQKLLGFIKKPAYQFPQKIMIGFISLAALYVFLTLQDPARQIPTDGISTASYYLPDWATIVTIVIPRLIMWFLGIQAIYYIFLYRQKVKGTLYKLALNNLARGLAWIVTATIILRCFQSLSTQLVHLSLGLLLLIVYALLGLIAIGYVLIAKGARSLRQIEEI